jgi:hypothetical protein
MKIETIQNSVLFLIVIGFELIVNIIGIFLLRDNIKSIFFPVLEIFLAQLE